MNIKANCLKYLILLVLLMTFSLTACAETTDTTASLTTADDAHSCSYQISVEISNNVEQIETHFVLCTTQGTNTGVTCPIYDLVDNINNLPSMEQTETMNLVKGFNVNISYIQVYDSSGILFETWNSWEERSALNAGQYFIQLYLTAIEDSCYISGYSIFVLNVN